MDYMCEHCKIDLCILTHFALWPILVTAGLQHNFRQELHLILVFSNIKKKKILPHIVRMRHMTFKFWNSFTTEI